ncbi:MAG: J domain-containing protein [Gammaproteobacteria bacterium]|nr:J domain-containing protein [Gammaproteobacteria bacterium]
MIKWKKLTPDYESNIEKMRNMSPFELLGVTKDSSLDEVKRMYRKKIKLYHPDKSDEFMKDYGEEISKILNQAYKKLLDYYNG